MYLKKISLLGAAYLLALIVANLTDSALLTGILAVFAGIIGILHIAYDVIWSIDTSWKETNQSTAQFAVVVTRKCIWDIIGSIVVIALVIFMIKVNNLPSHLVSVACIATISYGAIRSAVNTATETSRRGRDEKLV